MEKTDPAHEKYHGIFLSHTGVNKPFVRQLHKDLMAHGVPRVWLDEAEIDIGDSLTAIRRKRSLLFVQGTNPLGSQVYATNEEAVLREWLNTRPMFILMNTEEVPEPKAADVPEEILERLDGRRPDFLVLDPARLWEHGIVLARDQLSDFKSGMPILIAVGSDELPPPLRRGRRERSEIEKQIQDALAVQVHPAPSLLTCDNADPDLKAPQV